MLASQTLSHKVILVGDSKVGKTSFFIRLIKNAPPRAVHSTIGMEYATKEIIHKNTLVKLKIWDTAGSEKYKSLTSFHFRQASAALLFYDLADIYTYEHVTDWLKDIQNVADDKIIIILVGNKLDLIHDGLETRCVTQEDVKGFCKRKNLLHIEISAKTGEGLQECVELLLNQLDNQPQQQQQQQLDEPQTLRQKCCNS